jgi:hypothetical protein
MSMAEKKDLEGADKAAPSEAPQQVAPKAQEVWLPRRREVFEALEKVVKKPQ